MRSMLIRKSIDQSFETNRERKRERGRL